MPPSYSAPGVYVEEVPSGTRVIVGADTAVTVFVGRTPPSRLADGTHPSRLTSLAEFERAFGPVQADWPLGRAVQDFFANGGTHARILRVQAGDADAAQPMGPPLQVLDYLGDAVLGSGLHALDAAEPFNLLCIPPDLPGGDTAPEVWQAALAVCVRRRAMLLVDAPAAWHDAAALPDAQAVAALGLGRPDTRNAALYFPQLLDARAPGASMRVPCGAVAGVYARTDARRGVWKSPAGAEAHVRGTPGPARSLTDQENSLLNPLAINCVRTFPQFGTVLWGARTMAGADSHADEYKYVRVRRLALHVEENLLRGTTWTVFEPNGEPLWAQLRGSVDAFMQILFRLGAFAGRSPREAYFVRCDSSTHTQADIAAGQCRLEVGFAPLKPAEFVVLSFLLQSAAR